MTDATPRRGLSPLSAPSPDDVETTFLPRRCVEVWELQNGEGDTPAITPRRSSGKPDDNPAAAHSARLVDSIPAPARIFVPPIPAAPITRASSSDSARSAGHSSLGSPVEYPKPRRSAASPTPWTDAPRPRRSATSPSEWDDIASPITPPSFAELRAQSPRYAGADVAPAEEHPPLAALTDITSTDLAVHDESSYTWPWRRWIITGIVLAVLIAMLVIWFTRV